MGKRIVIALGGNALGNNLPEQMIAVKQTARAIADLIEDGHQVILSHGNGPQVGMIQKAMAEGCQIGREEHRMVTLTIDNRQVTVPEGTTIMEAAQKLGIQIPHLCYLKDVNRIAACRVCCVEVEGERAMVTACNSFVKEGILVHTNSPRARKTRRTNVELILSQHDCKCATCVRSGSCQLQTLANDLGILTVPYETQLPKGLRGAWTTTFPLYHDYNKCIKCMRCVQIRDKVQSLGIWDVAGTGGRTVVDVSGNRVIKDSDCALCGQCITHCPVGGLREQDDTGRAFATLADRSRRSASCPLWPPNTAPMWIWSSPPGSWCGCSGPTS